MSFLKDLFSQLTHSLGLDDESRVFLGLVIFKEKLMLTLLMRALEVLRDILIILPLSTKQLEDPQNAAKYRQYSGEQYKDYVDKIVVERRFTARFVYVAG